MNANQNLNYENSILNKFAQNHVKNDNLNVPKQQQTQTHVHSDLENDKIEIDLDYLNNVDDNESKREYLGEIIFKKIENHPLAQKYEFSINKIGKTTGMILAIDDINYILDICRNEDNLAAYINEAHELLKESEN